MGTPGSALLVTLEPCPASCRAQHGSRIPAAALRRSRGCAETSMELPGRSREQEVNVFHFIILNKDHTLC